MSVLSFDPTAVLPLAVLGASLLGSGHCVAMCGGLIVSMARSPRALAFYHFGRLTGYLVLGAAAGFAGERVLELGRSGTLAWAATLFLGLGFIVIGVRAWGGRGIHFSLVPASWLKRLYPLAKERPWLAGAFSALLPCGWLHSFVLAAVATRSAWGGALFLTFFWAGTLPALTAAPYLFQRVLAPIQRRLPRLSAWVLILVGVFCVGGKVLSGFEAHPPAGGEKDIRCHSGRPQ